MKYIIRHLSLRIEDMQLRKFRYVSEYEGRSANSQLLVMIRNAIQEFEKEHGEITFNSEKPEA